MNNTLLHTPVLSNEVINLFNINTSGTYVDCTAGFGGHSELILKKLDDNAKLICVDQDQFATQYLRNKFNNDKRVRVINDNFINVVDILNKLNTKKIDGALADLGVSSVMLDDDKRGFSYHKEARLDMRMNQNQKLDAHFILNNYDAKQLCDIFRNYGEISRPQNVVNGIIKYRQTKNIDTTSEFVHIIKSSIYKPELFKKKHPATKYFQAVRIEVNNELENLKTFLSKVTTALKKSGILLVITFHSLEDRIVKQYFQKLTSKKIPHEIPIKNEKVEFVLLNKKPIIATNKEIQENNRARSAKLRGVMRV
jgi:16S rRNA (cytosine1402-N4)-methyltransferase